MMRAFAMSVCLLALACDKGKPTEKQLESKRAPADAAMATTEDCDKLLAHLVRLEFATSTAAATTEAMRAEIEKQATAVIEAKFDEFMQSCAAMPRARAQCALAAPNLDAVTKCDDEPVHNR